MADFNLGTFSDYSRGSPSAPIGSAEDQPAAEGYWTLERLKRSYLDYLGSKRNEILEQQDSRRYRHGSQWDAEQIRVFNKRKQPIVTYNHVGPKINGVIGLIEKLRQDPKAFPRNPGDENAAELVTACVREVLDEAQWKSKSPACAENGAVDGLGGVEIDLIQNGDGTVDVNLNVVRSDEFFYDPRSAELDFSDARFLGWSKWVDVETAVEMFPDKEEELRAAVDDGLLSSNLTTNADRDWKWYISDGNIQKVRLVDCWYKRKGQWQYCTFSSTLKLAEGVSPFVDNDGNSANKYVMYSANVDQDGDRYGFCRQFRSVQDEINQRRSKGLHILNSRRIIAAKGAFESVERTRLEATRPDGIIEINPGFEDKVHFDDSTRLQETEAQLKFLQEAKAELDQYGPTLSLVGEQQNDISGRAIQIQQQAGLAQLGPFILSYRNWKVRVYRNVWWAIKKFWTQERYVRITNDPQAIQYLKVNTLAVNPMTGMPQMVNQVAKLDVDIVLDEGPDVENMQADTNQALMSLAQAGAQVPPQLLIETSPLDPQTKKKYLDMLNQGDPMAQQKQMLEMQNAQATVAKTAAQAKLANAQAFAAVQGQATTFEQPENPAVVAADVAHTEAKTLNEKAKALQSLQAVAMAPQQAAHDQAMDRQGAAQSANDSAQSAQLQREASQAKDDASSVPAAPKKKKKGSVSINLDGSIADRINRMADEHGDRMTTMMQAFIQAAHQHGAQMANATGVLANAANRMADASEQTAKAMTAPKRLVRDAKGRASHVETMNNG